MARSSTRCSEAAPRPRGRCTAAGARTIRSPSCASRRRLASTSTTASSPTVSASSKRRPLGRLRRLPRPLPLLARRSAPRRPSHRSPRFLATTQPTIARSKTSCKATLAFSSSRCRKDPLRAAPTGGSRARTTCRTWDGSSHSPARSSSSNSRLVVSSAGPRTSSRVTAARSASSRKARSTFASLPTTAAPLTRGRLAKRPRRSPCVRPRFARTFSVLARACRR
mmetsp:Transcript_17342/g.55208  ORF Transcript_17342/g.55208 Transcript_17342/m.55208 type:complete len:224 (-) Transcript_17342:101-772(-)